MGGFISEDHVIPSVDVIIVPVILPLKSCKVNSPPTTHNEPFHTTHLPVPPKLVVIEDQMEPVGDAIIIGGYTIKVPSKYIRVLIILRDITPVVLLTEAIPSGDGHDKPSEDLVI